ncbi:MAG: LemA family protein [Chromatiales bacterium]|nr:LemA family protein [Chromatiales bacterium]
MRGLVRFFPIAVLLGLLTGCGINNIPTFDEETTAKWSQVVNQYKRRADLIPNLVKTVQGYASHEKDVLTQVTEARAKVSQMQLPPDVLSNPDAFKSFEQNQSQLTSALSRLMLVVERYPDLKASQNFLALQSQLEGTENRISVARRDYIEAVKVYNTELRTIPGRWWRDFLYPEAQPKQNFSVAEDEMKQIEKAPEVQFN